MADEETTTTKTKAKTAEAPATTHQSDPDLSRQAHFSTYAAAPQGPDPFDAIGVEQTLGYPVEST
jgi:hypothetical protein